MLIPILGLQLANTLGHDNPASIHTHTFMHSSITLTFTHTYHTFTHSYTHTHTHTQSMHDVYVMSELDTSGLGLGLVTTLTLSDIESQAYVHVCIITWSHIFVSYLHLSVKRFFWRSVGTKFVLAILPCKQHCSGLLARQ